MNPTPLPLASMGESAHSECFFVLANNCILANTDNGTSEPLPGVDGNPGDGDIFPKEKASQGGGLGHRLLAPMLSQTLEILRDLLFWSMELIKHQRLCCRL